MLYEDCYITPNWLTLFSTHIWPNDKILFIKEIHFRMGKTIIINNNNNNKFIFINDANKLLISIVNIIINCY